MYNGTLRLLLTKNTLKMFIFTTKHTVTISCLKLGYLLFSGKNATSCGQDEELNMVPP